MKNKDFFAQYIHAFLNQNSFVNLISKNDEKFLWEKHIFDSLSIEKFFEKFGIHDLTGMNLLDFGTGGGFPSVPLALAYPELEVIAVDSIRKKVNAISAIKDELNITNLVPVCTRVENLGSNSEYLSEPLFDIVTSRAVASLDKIVEYALPKLKDNGYFVAYKSRKVSEEIEAARTNLKKYKAEIIDIIEYALPLEENYTRNLVIIQKR